MKEGISLQDKMVDRNWVMKRKRKRVSSGLDASKEKESISPCLDAPKNKISIRKKPRADGEISHFGDRIKGHDGYYFECEVCDLGGNLLCCDSCPRTYHLECLNPPLKRAPPGRWQCPGCCEQKNDVTPLSNVETSSRRARSKSNFKKHKSIDKLSGHDKPPPSGRTSSLEKDKSSDKGKRIVRFRSPSVKKKPGCSQADISYSPKSSASGDSESRNGLLAAADSSIKKNQESSSFCKTSSHKEILSPVVALSAEANENMSKSKGNLTRGERKKKKHILSLVPSPQISKKNRNKVNGVDKKNRSRAHKGKNAVADSDYASKETSPLPGTSDSLYKNASFDRQKSASSTKKNTRVLKLSIKKHRERSSKEAFPSSHEINEFGEKTDKTMKYHENIQDGLQQVDRILGCRVRRSTVISSCHTIAIKSTVSAAPTNIVCNSEKEASLSSPCDFADPENGYKEKSKDFSGVEDKYDGKAVNDKDMDAPHEDKTYQAKENKDVVMTGTGQVNNPQITQVGCDLHEKSSVTAVAMVDTTAKIHSDENGNMGTLVSDHQSHHAHVSHDYEVTNGESTVAPLVSSTKKLKHTQVSQDLVSKDEAVTYEFLVKWVGQSNIHNSWISESQVKILAKRKLENYKAKYGTSLINICEEQWCDPQRVIALRVSKDGTKEALTKWRGLPYDECTWERLDEPVIEMSSHLITEFERLEYQTVENDARDMTPRAKIECQEVSYLTEQPKELNGGSLFPHQLEALNWLRKCWQKSKNVILADEMGLGKTVSASAFISSLYVEFKAKLPCLVLVPLSTMPNWMAEFSLWAPHLNVVEYHGPAKARSIIRQYEWHASRPDGSSRMTKSFKFNVLLTTYEMVLADSSFLRGVPWEVLLVDEGHRLKNSESKLFSLLNTFSFQHRVLLTGTPLQNNIGEMYNLLNFLQPASFPSLSAFEEKFNDLTTAERVDELKKLVAPHMLRRLKKVCNHPYLIPGTEPESGSVEFLQEMRINASAKLTLLHSMLKVLHKEGHRVLIFSQMTKLLDILEDYLLIEFGPRTFERADGSVSVADRQAAIARFNQDKSRFVFLLSTRSYGLAINLATADTVIIYDSDFNLHADIQAMNRAHRIGQSKRLLVYRLVVRASVEERILQHAKKKLMLDQLFVNKSESQKEVEDSLRWGTEELFNDCDGVNVQDSKEPSSSKVEIVTDGEQKHRRRSGGLGDVYQDRCTDSSTKIVWDENAIFRTLVP